MRFDINFFYISREFGGVEMVYEPIAVIHHTGEVDPTRNTTRGHFMADIKNTQNKWYRTSDNAPPRQIKSSNVSKKVYVILYKQL